MSQSFIKKPDNGPHSALAGLGMLRSERAPANPLDVLRRIVAWRDNVHAGGVVRSADLEALIEEARELLPDGVNATFPRIDCWKTETSETRTAGVSGGQDQPLRHQTLMPEKDEQA